MELNNIDYNCFIGKWPFSWARQTDLDKLGIIHEAHGIDSGYVSCLDSVLYNDPMEGNLELAKFIKNTLYEMVPCMNPLLPNPERDFRISYESFDYRAVRIMPTVHGYDLDDPNLLEFAEIAASRQKGLIVHTTFGDPRLDYLLLQKPINLMKLPKLLEKTVDTPLLLCNIRLNEISELNDVLETYENIYIDMSELKHSMFSIEHLKEKGLLGRLVFGSFYPMFDFSGAYVHFRGADENTRDRILGNNIFQRGIK